MKKHKNKSIYIFIMFFFILFGTNAFAFDTINGVKIGTVHLATEEVIFYVDGTMNGSPVTNVVIHMYLTHNNYKEIYATALNAKLLNLSCRIDVIDINADHIVLKNFILY